MDGSSRATALTTALIADDDPLAAMVVSQALRQWGINAITAPDGASAWAILTGERAPSLAIVDWMMPVVDGLELCRRIRQDPAHAHMYLIVLTSRDEPADVISGLEAGADDYLVKPFRPGELRARIGAGLRVLSLQSRLAERIGDLEIALSQVKELRGLLPICSYCKRIRNDENYWQQVDSYIAEHTDAQFSHGICPHCIEGVMREANAHVPGAAAHARSRRG
jgi:sigma-B regulation protein RsbU (phosphoserine phosphatase)